MPAKSTVLAVATLVTAAGIGAGVALHSSDEPASTAPSATTTTTLADVDTTRMVVARGPFCGRVDDADVRAALGGKVVRTASYGDGDSAAVTGSLTDVAQEYSCSWAGPGTSARAWVFAPPVTRAWAHRLVAVPKGCQRRPGPAYGRPSAAFTCTTDRRHSVTLHGLFGDAWLTCELSGRQGESAGAVAGRAGRWCLVVARRRRRGLTPPRMSGASGFPSSTLYV